VLRFLGIHSDCTGTQHPAPAFLIFAGHTSAMTFSNIGMSWFGNTYPGREHGCIASCRHQPSSSIVASTNVIPVLVSQVPSVTQWSGFIPGIIKISPSILTLLSLISAEMLSSHLLLIFCDSICFFYSIFSLLRDNTNICSLASSMEDGCSQFISREYYA